MASYLDLGASILMWASVIGPVAQAPERDILAALQPLHVQVEVDGNYKPAEYGDPVLAQAVARLSDIPRPWTVTAILRIYEPARDAWLKEHSQNYLRPDLDQESRRCGDLARLLAASRDPRAAFALGTTWERIEAIGLGRSPVYIGAGAVSALFDYFVGGDLNYGLPPEQRQIARAGNLAVDRIAPVNRWWAANKSSLAK